MIDYEIVKSSILCGIFGDMLGSEIEFIQDVKFLEKIGPEYGNGIQLIDEDENIPTFTDDTQMTLFTLEGLVRTALRYADRGIADYTGVVRNALVRWYLTQGGEAKEWSGEEIGLLQEPLLKYRAAPGNTCLQALSASTASSPMANNNSKGCGTIMRVAPVGLLVETACVADVAISTSKITHGHPTAAYAASAWAEMLSLVMGGGELPDTINKILRKYRSIDGAYEVCQAIDNAINTPRDGKIESVVKLGQGWVAEECLSIALYTCLYALELSKNGASAREASLNALWCAARHPGDSDSTAAVAGNMLGIIFPLDTYRDVIMPFWSLQFAEKIVDRFLDQHKKILNKNLIGEVDRTFIAPN